MPQPSSCDVLPYQETIADRRAREAMLEAVTKDRPTPRSPNRGFGGASPRYAVTRLRYRQIPSGFAASRASAPGHEPCLGPALEEQQMTRKSCLGIVCAGLVALWSPGVGAAGQAQDAAQKSPAAGDRAAAAVK